MKFNFFNIFIYSYSIFIFLGCGDTSTLANQYQGKDNQSPGIKSPKPSSAENPDITQKNIKISDNKPLPNDLRLQIVKTSDDIKRDTGIELADIVAKEGNRLYFSTVDKLYVSEDGLETVSYAGYFPASTEEPAQVISTKAGDYYIKVDTKIYHAQKGFQNIQETDAVTESYSLKNAFAYDPISDYIYTGDYLLEYNRHKYLYRGHTAQNLADWQKIYDFTPFDIDQINSIYHIHLVTVDPYTGRLWIGTGDDDRHSRLYYSDDHGDSFHLFAVGSQNFRTLAMWFTKDYIYWNTDSESVAQSIFRVSRKNFLKYRSLTPRLSTGMTKAGIRYYVVKSEPGYFPEKTARIYTETRSRELDDNNIVIAINDPAYDFKETVATLSSGSMWYHLWIKDLDGNDCLLMSTAAEGSQIDGKEKKARVYCIKELTNHTVSVREVFSIKARPDSKLPDYVQLIPYFQDNEKYIYFRGRETDSAIYKMKLTTN